MLNALEIVDTLKLSGEGLFCQYYRVDEQTGIKKYNNNEGRIEYRKSRLAYKFGIGPRVWGYCYDGYYSAFYVEHVITMFDILTSCESHSTIKCSLRDLHIDTLAHFRKYVFDLAKKANIDFSLLDLHTANVGFIRCKPVIIDFSHCRVGDIPSLCL